MILERASWPEVEEFLKESSIAILPIGSTEQHGPHASLNTDSLIAESLAKSVSNSESVLVTPTVRISVSSYHGDFPGTLWISPSTFRSYLKDLLDSLVYHGSNKIILVNGHGGNRCSLDEVSLEFNRKEGGTLVVPWTWFDAIEKTVRKVFGNKMLHADGPETSVLMYLDRQLVHEDILEKAEESGGREWRDKISGTPIPQSTRKFSQSGATGEPSTASKDKGRKLFQAAKEDLERVINELSSL